jgi:alpha-L-fucosidase
MGYLVLTAKHHDGFCLWDSALSDHDMRATPYPREPLVELAEACERHGVRFCVYYSLADWHHPHYAPQNERQGGAGERLPEGVEPDMERYVAYMQGQLEEIVTRTRPGLLWFDGQWETPWTPQRAEDLRDFLWALDPALIVNDRVGKDRAGPGDYDTPEQRIGAFQPERPWETCMTVATQWAWKPDDPVKPLSECLRALVRCACGDGNLLFNVGPRADGTIEPVQAERLRAMGAWLAAHGETIHATRGGPWECGEWGGATWRGDRVWLHLLEAPDELVLPAWSQRVESAALRGGGTVEWRQDEVGRLHVRLPAGARDPIDTILELRVHGPVRALAAPGGPLGRFDTEARFGERLGRDAAVSLSSTSQWDDPAQHALLVDPTSANPEFVLHTGAEREPWVTIDLREPCRVTALAIEGRPGWPERMRGLTLATSLDGEEWKLVWAASEPLERYEIPLLHDGDRGPEDGLSARYLRIAAHHPEPGYLHLRSVRIWGRLP